MTVEFEYKIDGELYVALEEHLAEVAVLTEEKKSLEKRLANAKAALARCRKQEEYHSRAASRQARWDADYVPYGEDERGD
jgi:septal ring factor EnvC (AmiA/AmiB activator)